MNKSRDCRLLWPSYTLRFLPSYSTPIQCGPHAECRRALPLALLFLCFRDGEVARSRNPPRYTILQHRQSAARTAILFLYDLLSSFFFMWGREWELQPPPTIFPSGSPTLQPKWCIGRRGCWCFQRLSFCHINFIKSFSPPELSSSPMLSAYKQHTNCEHFFVQN